jgi:hypothetical protein
MRVLLWVLMGALLVFLGAFGGFVASLLMPRKYAVTPGPGDGSPGVSPR